MILAILGMLKKADEVKIHLGVKTNDSPGTYVTIIGPQEPPNNSLSVTPDF
jgi:hypothetical protein